MLICLKYFFNECIHVHMKNKANFKCQYFQHFVKLNDTKS